MMIVDSTGFQGGREHAVVRTTELLSCARTALRIAQQESQKGLLHLSDDVLALNPNDLSLYIWAKPLNSTEYFENRLSNTAADLVRESQSLLALLDSQLEKLSALVKRRGQTNDPTLEINSLMAEFNSYTKDLMEIIQKSLAQAAARPFYHGIQSSHHRIKHFQIVANTIQHHVENRMRSFKDIMTIRGDAIQELNQRRRRLLEGRTGADISHSTDTSFNSTSMTPQTHIQNTPLFTMTESATTRNRYGNATSSYNQNNRESSREAPSFIDTKAPTGYPYTFYGGGNNLSSTGMRRRGLHPTNDSTNTVPVTYSSTLIIEQDEEEKRKRNKDQNNFQSQIQLRMENRQKQSRLESAREAEKSLSELTTMFQKMSTLIQSQGEVLTKVEDDVEAAFAEVNAGAEEITKLYLITKGNRVLIIKVFSLLILIIIFMRFYR